MSVRVALLLFGLPRFVQYTDIGFQSHFTQVIKNYKTDVFCHLWTAPNEQVFCHGGPTSAKTVISSDSKQIIQERYSPIAIKDVPLQELNFSETLKTKVRPYFKKDEYKFTQPQASALLGQMAAVEHVCKLFNDTADINSYDWVILTRYDILISKMVDLKQLDPSFFYTVTVQRPKVYVDSIFTDMIQIFSPRFLPAFLTTYSKIEENILSAEDMWGKKGFKAFSPESLRFSAFTSMFKPQDVRELANLRCIWVERISSPTQNIFPKVLPKDHDTTLYKPQIETFWVSPPKNK